MVVALIATTGLTLSSNPRFIKLSKTNRNTHKTYALTLKQTRLAGSTKKANFMGLKMTYSMF
jgi:hypothetical protein